MDKLNEFEKKELQLICEQVEKVEFSGITVDKFELATDAYVALGRRFRNRIRKEAESFGRVDTSKHSGVFHFVFDCIRDFNTQCLCTNIPDLDNVNSRRKKHAKKLRNNMEKGCHLLDQVIISSDMGLFPKKFEETKQTFDLLKEQLEQLTELAETMLTNPIKSQTEQFIATVCSELYWIAGINIPNPRNEYDTPHPLLLMIENFLPEPEPEFRKLYQRDMKKRSSGAHLGHTYIMPNKKSGKKD